MSDREPRKASFSPSNQSDESPRGRSERSDKAPAEPIDLATGDGEAADPRIPSMDPEDTVEALPPDERPLPAPADAGGPLAPSDTLTRYLWEIGKNPVLSREEEHEMAVRYVEHGDIDAAYKLVASNLRLVVKIANEYRRAAFNLLDLIQEGNVGLMLAVKKFDPYKGVKLSTYAAWWIRAYIIRYVMDNWRLVKLGTTQTQRKLFFNLRKEKRKLESMGFKPESKLLAENLDVQEQDIVDMEQRLAGADSSLQAPVGSEEGSQTLGDRLKLEGDGTDEVLADIELRSIFREKLERFGETIDDERDRAIFRERLLAEDPLTLQEIGSRFGVSRERARQIEKKLIGRLKEHMEREIPDFGELVVQDRD